MKTRAVLPAVLAFVSVFGLLPAPVAAMGLSWGTPPTVSQPVVTTPVAANATATITCAAQDLSSVSSLSVTVSGGTLANGGTTQAVAITPGASVSGTATWVAPAVGPVTITCSARNSSNLSAASSLVVTVQAAAPPSVVIDSLTGPTAPVLVGAAVSLQAAAHDPAGGTVSYAWSTSAETLQASGATATLTAPAVAGGITVTLTVSSTSGSTAATGTLGFSVILAGSQGALGDSLLGPQRLALAPEGYIYVVDGQGGFHILTAKGESMGTVQLPDHALAVAAAPGEALVSTVHGKILRVDSAAARVVGAVDVGYALGPMGLAFDESTKLLWLAERDAGQLRAIRLDGTTVMVARSAGGQQLAGANDVAIDAASGLVWVALDYNPGGAMAHAFKLSDGSYSRSILGGGTGSSQVTRAGGIAVDASGRVFVSDVYTGNVQVTSGPGVYLGALGSFGSGTGELRQPAGVLALPTGDVLVANSDDGRLERYGNSPALASCPGDSDCDGMPDWWEIAHGLNPYWAGDALLDYDHDGLTNLQEFRYGTDPWNWDTDGDGVSDGDEVLAGTDPRVDDRKPVLVASDPQSSGPGLLRWSSSLVRGRGTCSVAWTQVGGPAVQLRGAATFAPSFVGRKADDYVFQGVAACGKGVSDPAVVTARIVDVAPRPDAGRIQVVHAGSPLALDGSFSSDANGDAFSLAWDQVLGRPIAARTQGADLLAQADGPGFFAFQLTAAEPARGKLSATAEVPVLVVDSGRDAPTAIAVSPVVAKAGAAVTLDAIRSVVRSEESRFVWQQVAGPAVALQGAETAAPSFVPPGAGRYAFELSIVSDARRSPPATVEVYVASPGQALPVATIQPAVAATVGQPLSLDGAASAGSGLSYRWRQVSGPAAGLTDADRAIATVVPFTAGSFVFELAVQAGDAVGVPARVRLEASAPGVVVPKAVAATRRGGDGRWMLDGRSSGPGALRYRWTQVGGPWVALDDAGSPTPSFRAKRSGLYEFELEVDDGRVRSAPARVTVVAGEEN